MQIFDANMDILSPTKKVGKFGLELANTYDIFVESHKHASIFALFSCWSTRRAKLWMVKGVGVQRPQRP